MTFASIALYVALIALFLGKRIKGEPVKTDKRLFVLPVVLVVIGWGQISHDSINDVATAFTVISAAIALGMGALRGAMDKLSTREGVPFMRWGRASLSVFAANIAIKLILDVILGMAGGTSGAAADSLMFVFGLTLLGEAGVLWLRTQAGSSHDAQAILGRLRDFS
jgi:hypothetical protein